MASLADIYKQEKKSGKGLGSALGKKALEKIDPRRMLEQSGLLVAMFPALKAYSAMSKKREKKEKDDVVTFSSSLSKIQITTGLTAKNTMVLPAMARDINLMRTNIQKLVKLSGGTPTLKADMFFKKAGERETLYEGALKKMGSSLFGKSFSLQQKRDGQSKETALFVKGVSKEDESGNGTSIFGWLNKPGNLKNLAGTIGRALPYVAVAGGLIEGFSQLASDYQEGSKRRKERGETMATEQKKAVRGRRTKGEANDVVKLLIKEKLTGDAAEQLIKEYYGSDAPSLSELLEECDSSLKDSYMSMVAQKETETTPPPEIPAPTPTPESIPEIPGPSPHEVPPGTVKAPAYRPEGARGGYRRRVQPTVTETQAVPSVVAPSETTAATRDLETSGGLVGTANRPRTTYDTKEAREEFKQRVQQIAPTSAPSSAPTPAPTSVPTTPTPAPSAKTKSLLDVIAGGESKGAGDYNAMNQGTVKNKIIGSGDSEKIINKKLTDMTVDEIMKRAAKPSDSQETREQKGLIFAAGRYQIIPSTLKSLVDAGIVKPEEKFSEEVQDRLGTALLNRRGLQDYLSGKLSGEKFQNKLAMEWASIPLATDVGEKKAGQSYYGGANVAHSKTGRLLQTALYGDQIMTASTSVADAKMSAMKSVPPTAAATQNVPPKRTAASSMPSSQTASAYDTDLFQTIVGTQYSAA